MKCPNCGLELSELHKFCTQCGTMLNKKEESGGAAPKTEAANYSSSGFERPEAVPEHHDSGQRDQKYNQAVGYGNAHNVHQNNNREPEQFRGFFGGGNGFKNPTDDDKTTGLFTNSPYRGDNNADADPYGYAGFGGNGYNPYGAAAAPPRKNSGFDKQASLSVIPVIFSLLSMIILFFNCFKIKSSYVDVSISFNILSINGIFNLVGVDAIDEAVGLKIIIMVLAFLLIAVAGVIALSVVVRYIKHDSARIIVPLSYILTIAYCVFNLIGLAAISVYIKNELRGFNAVSLVPTIWIFVVIGLSAAGLICCFLSGRKGNSMQRF
ncbi:MAG TPA: hypothetical protein H9900_01290 [Candidatus Monoglobus merdigallinarum]|uniref:Zinc-ribbon domain-containing protein n=1 Tax=Candidatus Monoglobus merdigallinarum TaxID=2838698 RepID=A0A9D1TL42_9FIRM|nr:hypothetical protein [Candidatus Monoglobus merdigallinarum]